MVGVSGWPTCNLDPSGLLSPHTADPAGCGSRRILPRQTGLSLAGTPRDAVCGGLFSSVAPPHFGRVVGTGAGAETVLRAAAVLSRLPCPASAKHGCRTTQGRRPGLGGSSGVGAG